jgi:hypothetical protein
VREQRREQEQPANTRQRAVVRQDPGVLESETHDMKDAALYERLNSAIAEHLSRFDQGLHHIKELHLRLHERLDHIVESPNDMHEKLSFLIGRKNDSFSCVGTIMSPIGR